MPPEALHRAVVVTAMVTSLAVAAGAAPHVSPQAAGNPAGEESGREIYQRACATCHGSDGRGAPQALLGFDTAVPDFTECSFVTVEPDDDWMAVSHDGGPARAFDRRMPAFGEALSDAELQRTIDYIRGFCPSRAWPHGNLNLPRALVTEKAFPENEAVLTTSVAATGAGAVGNELLYEQRIGARSQFEIAVPIQLQEGAGGTWGRGLGDVAMAVKHALYHDAGRGHILSVAGEVILPTGKETEGLGRGVTVFEPFVAFGQILPGASFLQAQAGLELPADTDRAEREAFWRLVAGRTVTQGRFGRAWSPMLELLAARALEDGATTHWDLVPQMQVTLNRRQHIMLNGGVRIPVNDREGRRTQVLVYLLWDWFDGGVLEGW